VNRPAPVWLFVSYGGGHVKALLPVARRVRELGLARPVYLALTTAAPEVRDSGLSTLGFRDFLRADNHRARAIGQKLAAQLQVPTANHEESVAYLGLSYADMEDRLGAAAAAQRYGEYGRQAFLPTNILKRVLMHCRPALVVATNSPRAERAAIEAARTMGVPSACLVDLLGIWERPLLARPDYADAVCVLNDSVRDGLVQAGRCPADVHVTGNPAFDTLHDPGLMTQGAQYRSALGWDSLHVCLYASSPEPVQSPQIDGRGDPALPRRIEQALVQAVRDNPALALWIRRHPSEAPAPLELETGHPRIRISSPSMSLHACIHASDEVVVTVSTVGVEASLAGKPVTQVRGSILDHLSPYLEMGLARRGLTLDQIASAYGPTAAPLAAATVRVPAAAPADAAANKVVDVLRSLQVRAHGR
jgi:hypothetical protein